MPVYQKADGVQMLESFMKTCGGTPREWYVGISLDAAGRLAQHGMEQNPYATWIEFQDAETARSVEDYFLQTGMQGDKGGGSAEKPPKQVYVYRAPKLTSFREFLQRAEQVETQQKQRKEKKEEWVRAVARLIGQLRAWLQEADAGGLLELASLDIVKAEQGLGEYSAPGLDIHLGETNVQVMPVARNVVGFVGPRGDAGVRAEGRVDITDGIRKYILYRTLKDNNERWYVLYENFEPSPLDQDRFMAIMEDLLS